MTPSKDGPLSPSTPCRRGTPLPACSETSASDEAVPTRQGFRRVPPLVVAFLLAAMLSAWGEDFGRDIRPLLVEYCTKCHSEEKQKGDLNLEPFTSIEAVKRHPHVWQTVAEQLANREMPPKDKPQPTLAEKERLEKWVQGVLDEIALAHAGDPGPVVLRRLSNAQYTYTIRDLTGIESLDPAREFPVDGAAGEGFTNTGQSLVMSPALVSKYLDAGKDVASHAVLVPGGIRFSSGKTRRDWTEEIIDQIRELYGQFTDLGSNEAIMPDEESEQPWMGGHWPLEKYLSATLEERAALAQGSKSVEAIARTRGLNAKYLGALFETLTSTKPSFVLDRIRAHWRAGSPAEAAAIAAEISDWQKMLWKFSSVGHIGMARGPKAWMEPVSPLMEQREIRFKIPPQPSGNEVTLYLAASNVEGTKRPDSVIWQRPRLVIPGRPDLLLRDVRAASRDLALRRARIFASTAKYLSTVVDVAGMEGKIDLPNIARKNGIEADALAGWLNYLGIPMGGPVTIDSHFTNKIHSAAGFDFIRGWGDAEAPHFVANSSDRGARIPGNMKPHSVALHPSRLEKAAVGWSSPVQGIFRVEAKITPAHPECANSITWSLELRRGGIRQQLSQGISEGPGTVNIPPVEQLPMRPGDLISVIIGPNIRNAHFLLSQVDLVLTSAGDDGRVWDLAKDVSPNVLASNPHEDRFGHPGVWHFYTEPVKGGSGPLPLVPPGSVLARWQGSSGEDKPAVAAALQKLLTSATPPAKGTPDEILYQALSSPTGPLLRGVALSSGAEKAVPLPSAKNGFRNASPKAESFALDPALFGKRPKGIDVDNTSLCVDAPSVLEVRLPAELAAGAELVVSGRLAKTNAESCVQLQVLGSKPDLAAEVIPGNSTAGHDNTKAGNAVRLPIFNNSPIVVSESNAMHQRLESAFEEFRQIFPAALCYTKIVPADEVVTLTLHFREDQQLARLMLDDGQKAKLDALWEELHYVSNDALTQEDAFEQAWQFATQGGMSKKYDPLREPIHQRAAAFRELLVATEPRHLDAVLEFAERAYRHPLSESEKEELRKLYRDLREKELPHEEAIRLTLARILVAPAFLYRAEKPGPGEEQVPVSDWELASRLSYFLWSSTPDAELSAVTAAGKLRDPQVLVAQSRRMLADPRVRRLAIEFGCSWLHIQNFDESNEKSERHFPTFSKLRGPMYEESIRFFTDLFQNDRPVASILDADYTFLNEALATHYEIPGVTGEEWRRVDGVKKYGRGGILSQATTLAKQSGASRTSPILRGNWVAEALLGDKLPRPPKGVPSLPDDEATETLTVRQLTEKHSADPACAKCHMRIDPFGFALENFDAIGRRRDKDLSDHPVDAHATTPDGTELTGLDGLRDYLLTKRRGAFLRQFCRKLLGYSLGRAVQLSDEPLLKNLQAQLEKNDDRVGALVELIVQSPQFRDIRGRKAAFEE